MVETSVETIIAQFRAIVASGGNWYLALLEAIRAWPLAEEEVNGACYYYLISDEALDLVQVSKRLIEAAQDIIPEPEQLALLFFDRPPVALSMDEMKERLGEEKYKQHLNFFYGITVEEALQEITAEEVRKEECGLRAQADERVIDEAFLRIYNKTHSELMQCFCAETGYAAEVTSLVEIKKFNYWLFKYRLAHSDPEKSASDTKKALNWLKELVR